MDSFERPGQEIAEAAARLLLEDQNPKREAEEAIWERLQRGEKVHVPASHLWWADARHSAIESSPAPSWPHPSTRLLRAAPVVLVAFDGDDAGERAAAWWLDALSAARRLVPEGDPAAMLEAGAEIRAWVEGGLA